MKKWVIILGLILCSSVIYAEYRYEAKRDQIEFTNQGAMSTNGDYFKAHKTVHLGFTEKAWIHLDLSIATKDMYLDYEVSSSSPAFSVILTHSPVGVQLPGTTIDTIANYNQARNNTSSFASVLYEGDGGLTDVGTTIDFQRKKGGEIYKNTETFVLSKGRKYLLIIENITNIGGYFSMKWNWYEK